MVSMIALTLLGLSGAEISPMMADTQAPVAVAPAPAPVAQVAQKQFLRKTADTSTTYDRYGSWQFGISGGNSTGGGLAVRHWFDEKNGIEIHGYVYLSKREYPQDQGSAFSSDYGSDGYYYGNDTGTVAQGEISLGVQYLHEVLRVHLFDGTGLLKGGNHLRGLTFVGVGGYGDFEDRNLRHQEYKSGYDPVTGYYSGSYVSVTREKHTENRKLLGGLGAGLELELNRFSVHSMVGYGGFYGLSSSTYELGPTFDGGLFVRF